MREQEPNPALNIARHEAFSIVADNLEVPRRGFERTTTGRYMGKTNEMVVHIVYRKKLTKGESHGKRQ